MGGEWERFKREEMHTNVCVCVCVCVADSQCCTTESNATLQNNYIPILKDKIF